MRGHIGAAWNLAVAGLAGRPLYLILHVTARCNARCVMCFNWNGMAARRPRPEHTLEELVRLAKSMRRLPQLTLSGGEPLLRADVADILAAFHTHTHTRLFTVPTNGLSPDRVAALIDTFQQKCPGAFLNLCLPFHSADPDGHDAIMGVPGSAAKRDATYAIIAEARRTQANISCSLNYVMSAANHDQYREVIETAEQRYPEATLGVAYARGVMHDPSAKEFPLQSYLDAQALLARRRKPKKGFNPYAAAFEAIAGQFADTISAVTRGQCDRLECRAGRRLLVIYDDGDVRPCELLETKPFVEEEQDASLGNLHEFDYDLTRLLGAPQARATLERLAAHPCACTWECAIYSSVLNSPARLARLCMTAARNLVRPRQ